tara:strand:+ start:1089 stop:1298 length:210 start_codon:yes stop_codon:yes gene_type:complete
MIQELAGSDHYTLQPGHTKAPPRSRKLPGHGVATSAGGEADSLNVAQSQTPITGRQSVRLEQLHHHQGS